MTIDLGGLLSSAILNYVALLGWSPEENANCTVSRVKEIFDVNGILNHGIFDKNQVNYFKAPYIARLSPAHSRSGAVLFTDAAAAVGNQSYCRSSSSGVKD